MCSSDLSKDPSLAKFVPNALRTCDDYLELWKTGQTTYSLLIQHTPAADLPRIYLAVLAANKDLLEHIPVAYRTKEMADLCIAARSKKSIPHIPPGLLTQPMYEKLVNENLIDLEHIPDAFVNQKIAHRFLSRAVKYFNLVPERFRTQQTVYLCVHAWGYKISSIPEKFRDELTYKLYLQQHSSLSEIPVAYWTENFLIAEMMHQKWGGYANPMRPLSDIPAHLQTPVYLAARAVRENHEKK